MFQYLITRIAFLIATSLTLIAQPSFSDPMIIREATHAEPLQSYLGDFDQDGDLDIVVNSFRGPALYWLENANGQGFFDGYTLISEDIEVSYMQIEVADLDGDGAPDVVASTLGDGALVWFGNDGPGGESWTETSIVDPDGNDHHNELFTTVDVDGDGDIDILRHHDSAYSWLPNLGLGEFGDPIEIPLSSSNNTKLITADMDADGDMDLLISDSERIRWIKNSDGLGAFTTIYIVREEEDWVYCLDVSDFNGDGFNDILVATEDSTWWAANQDSGSIFTPAIKISDWGRFCTSIDYDLDGDQDIAVAGGALILFENITGSGSFQVHGDSVSNHGYTRNLNPGDIDGDGDLDLLRSGGYVHGLGASFHFNWYENTDSWDPVRRSVSFNAGNVMLEDFDGDGTPEAIMTSENTISWYSDISISNPGVGHEISVPSGGGRWDTIIPFFDDLDDDGDLDMLYYFRYWFSSFSNPSWMFNLVGNGSFGNANYLEDTFGPMELGDMDGDGDADLVAIQKDPLRIVWIEHTDQADMFSTPHLIAPIDFELKEDYIRFKIADVDSDGDLDVVSHGEHQDGVGSELLWYENLDGMGAFSNPSDPHVIMDNVYFNCKFGDINGDSALDILVKRDTSYYLLVNSGSSGIFETALPFPATGSLVEFVDLDNDSDMDIVQNQSTGIAWMENLDGQGNFSESSLIASGVAFGGAKAFGDIDRDGIKDILGVVPNEYGVRSCVWLKGEGVTGVDGDNRIIPSSLTLYQNYPNPFNPATTIQYELPQRSDVQITVYDLAGRQVTTLLSETQEAGLQSVQWNATSVPSGMYFYQIKAGEFVQTKKMVLLK